MTLRTNLHRDASRTTLGLLVRNALLAHAIAPVSVDQAYKRVAIELSRRIAHRALLEQMTRAYPYLAKAEGEVCDRNDDDDPEEVVLHYLFDDRPEIFVTCRTDGHWDIA